MNRKFGVALLVLCAPAPSLVAAQALPDSAEREVLALHREINEAMFSSDPEPLSRAALDNLTVVPPGGYPETREQVIRGARNFRTDSVAYSEREVHVRGNSAVVTAKLMVHGELHGVDPATGQPRVRELTGEPLRQMSVFVREQDRWRLLAQSSTPIRGFGGAPRATVAQAQPDAASPAATAVVEREVREALLAEQRAFLAGDRATLKAFLSADPFPFVVSGCLRGDKVALPPCGLMFANPGERPRRSTERHDVYVLGSNAAYTITHYVNQITRPEGTITRYPSVVTKIWARQGDAWRIVHFHESLAQPPSP